MEVVRNSINVAGLADESTLPDRIHGQIIQYSETDTIEIDENQPEISSIYQIILKVTVNESRYIRTPVGNTVVLDGVKTFKVVYTQKSESGKANFIELHLPYNTYIEIPDNTKIDSINLYILDAYFDLLAERRIYSHIVYLVDVKIVETAIQTEKKTTVIEEQNITSNEIEEVMVDIDEEYL